MNYEVKMAQHGDEDAECELRQLQRINFIEIIIKLKTIKDKETISFKIKFLILFY